MPTPSKRSHGRSGELPLEPQGYIAGVPYDLRRPTVARVKERWWNSSDQRLFTPKAFGAGWDLNLYWLAHPREYLGERRTGA
jgi:hypothetical protein